VTLGAVKKFIKNHSLYETILRANFQ
jgi:hypothetical protein